MSDPRPVRASLGPVLWVFGALSLLATCAEPVTQDYTQRFPLGAQPETVSVPARYVGAADPFAGDARETFDTLVHGYLDRGHGPITIAALAPRPGTSPTPARIEQLRQRLIAAGVPASAIRVMMTEEGAPNTVTLSYERYSAVLPTCGDWSTPMDFNPMNTAYPNFGCDQQRNLGQMVADPADLVSMHQAQPSDTANTERLIKDYRSVVPSSVPPVATESVKNSLELNADQNAATGTSVGQNSGGSGASTR
jgi:pilus biogenesis lipoprotein CpaD